MKRKALCAALALCVLFGLPASAAAGEVSVAVQDGYTSDWGIKVPFTRSGRTDSYTFALYSGGAAAGTPEVTAAVTVNTGGPVTVSLPLRYDVTGPGEWTLKVTSSVDPVRTGLDGAALLTRTFTVAEAPTCGCAAGTPGAYYVGSGTAASPYRIGNQAQLSHMRKHLATAFKLESDLALAGSWTPVGSQSVPFTGVLDGNKHTVSGLNARDGGLFYTVSGSGAAVRNLTLHAPKVETTYVDAEVIPDGARLVLSGAVAAVVQAGAQIVDCTVENADLYSHTTERACAISGGISGWADNARFVRCRASGSLQVESLTAEYSGGIVGENVESTYIECRSSVAITSSTIDEVSVGGIVGVLSGFHSPLVMQNCRWTDPTHAVGQPDRLGGPYTLNTGECYGNEQVASID